MKRTLVDQSIDLLNSPLLSDRIIAMKEGDLVRLKQPFRPEPGEAEYIYGIVAGLTPPPKENYRESVLGVVLNLYNPQTLLPYADAAGTKVLFYFKADEVERIATSG